MLYRCTQALINFLLINNIPLGEKTQDTKGKARRTTLHHLHLRRTDIRGSCLRVGRMIVYAAMLDHPELFLLNHLCCQMEHSRLLVLIGAILIGACLSAPEDTVVPEGDTFSEASSYPPKSFQVTQNPLQPHSSR